LAAVSSKASISAQPSLVKIDHIQPGIRGAIDPRNLALVVNRGGVRVHVVRHSQAEDQFRGRRQSKLLALADNVIE
jgi:hypothetical protein